MENTYVPIGRQGWWGDVDLRVRCKFDDKVAFSCWEEAERSARKIRERGSLPGDDRMHAYQGVCGNWHVGHSKKKK